MFSDTPQQHNGHEPEISEEEGKQIMEDFENQPEDSWAEIFEMWRKEAIICQEKKD